jgi:hypothetical protein
MAISTKTLGDITPEVWSNVVLAGLRQNLVGELICNKNFKQELWGKGDTLNIQTMGTLTDAQYTDSNITYEALTDSNQQLVIDQEQYVAFKDEDAERNNISVNYMTEVMTDAGYQLGDFWDNQIMAEYANAGIVSQNPAAASWQITATTAANLPALFGALKRELKAANAPAGSCYFIAPPEIEEAITLYFGSKGPASQYSDDYAKNANYAGKFFGVETFISNNCVTEGSNTHGLAGVMGTSIALANDVITDEALRLEGRIANGYRMLSIGGVKTYKAAISIDVDLNSTVIATS